MTLQHRDNNIQRLKFYIDGGGGGILGGLDGSGGWELLHWFPHWLLYCPWGWVP